MGFHDDADIEEWERLCEKSQNITPIENWKDFIANWSSKEGDLYLIPPGTMHGHGGNQMVLEMDTNPSINGTEYLSPSKITSACKKPKFKSKKQSPNEITRQATAKIRLSY